MYRNPNFTFCFREHHKKNRLITYDEPPFKKKKLEDTPHGNFNTT